MGMSRTRERVSYIVSMLDATIAALKSEAKAVRCACTALWHSALSSRFPCIATWLRAAGMFLSTHLYLHMPAHDLSSHLRPGHLVQTNAKTLPYIVIGAPYYALYLNLCPSLCFLSPTCGFSHACGRERRNPKRFF